MGDVRGHRVGVGDRDWHRKFRIVTGDAGRIHKVLILKRLPQKICEAELSIQPLSRVRQVFRDEDLQSEVFVRLAHEHEATSEVTRDPWNATFRKLSNVS